MLLSKIAAYFGLVVVATAAAVNMSPIRESSLEIASRAAEVRLMPTQTC